MTQQSNHKSKTPKGKPSGSERNGSGLKDVNLSEPKDQAIEDQYLDEQGQPAQQINLKHKNRNTDKGREDQGKDTSSI